MIRRALITGAIVAASAASGTASAAPALHTGTWWRAQVQDGLFPAPAEIPSGGLWVSGNPLGQQAVAAVRVIASGGTTPTRLTLHVHSGDVTAPGSVEACLSTKTWRTPGATPGAWAEAPTYDCEKGRSTGSASKDGQTISFDLSVLARGSICDFVLITGAPSQTANVNATFERMIPQDVQFSPSATRTAEPGDGAAAGPPVPAQRPEVPTGQDADLKPGTFTTPMMSPPGTSSSSPPLIASDPASPSHNLQPVALPDRAEPVQRKVAILLFGLLGFWAAALVSRGASHRPPAGGTPTLYRGSPPGR